MQVINVEDETLLRNYAPVSVKATLGGSPEIIRTGSVKTDVGRLVSLLAEKDVI